MPPADPPPTPADAADLRAAHAALDAVAARAPADCVLGVRVRRRGGRVVAVEPFCGDGRNAKRPAPPCLRRRRPA
jgi:hypothetical protein